MYKSLIITLLSTLTLFGDHYYHDGKKEILTPIPQVDAQKNRSLSPGIDYYNDRSGERLGVGRTLIVRFKDISIQKEIEQTFSLTLLQDLGKNAFLYQVKTSKLTLPTANKIHLYEEVEYAHPDFIIKKQRRSAVPNDPLFHSSWHLDSEEGIDVAKAWDFTKGAGVRVAIYDEGVDLEHEDLVDNIIGYGNFHHDDGQIEMRDHQKNNLHNAPQSSSDNWHGTSCAGIIAARNNNAKGSTGIAPESKLIGVRYADSSSGDIRAFNQLMDVAKVDIVSNSWGTYKLSPEFNNILEKLDKEGRGGKGALVFFATGNDGCNMDKYYVKSGDKYYCSDNTQDTPINDESESPYVISIAAATKYKQIADYSNYGDNVDFAAVGENIVTTDAMGAKGAKKGNYTHTFTGTSAATPIAAGIAALVIAENPNLSKEEVLDIFKATAKKSGVQPYANGRNKFWGYGELNAGAAVTLASHYGKANVENFAQKIYQDMH